jgi:hypothetical protein
LDLRPCFPFDAAIASKEESTMFAAILTATALAFAALTAPAQAETPGIFHATLG